MAQRDKNQMTTSLEKNIAWQRHLEDCTTAADAMRREEVFTDVVIICGDREFAAHRLILSGASPYFRAMLHYPMMETNTGRIVLKNLDPDVIEIVLDFIYTGTIKEIEEDKDLLKAVLEASHMLLVDRLFDYLIQVMAKELSNNNFAELWNIAELYNLEELLREIKEKVGGKDFEAASSSADFLNLTSPQIKQILPLVNSDLVDVAMKAIIEWVKADEKQRLDELPSLMKEVRLNLLSESYLRHLLGNESVIHQSQDSFRQLVAISLHCFEWKRRALGSKLLCFAKNASSPRSSNVFIKEKNSWSKPTILSFMLTRSMSVLGYTGEIYFIGCMNNSNGDTDEVWKYSPTDNSCRTILRLDFPVSAAVAVDLLGFIYILGGYDTQNLTTPSPVKIVQRFSPDSLKCEQVASTNEAHWFPVVGQLLDLLYVTSNSGIVERFDPRTNQWSTIKPIPPPCFGCCGSFGEGKVYVMANKKHPCELEVYDPASDEWEHLTVSGTGPNHINSRWTVRTNEPNRSVMVVHDKANDTVHYYNPGCNSWQLLSPISLKQFSLAEFCVVLTDETDEKLAF